MKQLSFEVLSGWPASTETWKFMQEMIEQVQSVAYLGGNNYILSGCTEIGSNVTSGWIVFNGEILPFSGGIKQSSIIIEEEVTVKPFFGGNILPFYKNRKVVFGVGENSILWSSIKRNTPTNSILNRIEKLEQIAAPFLPVIDPNDETVHIGGMLLWKKPAHLIPIGWQEVQDWRGRLPLGYDPGYGGFNEVGKTGGSRTHTLQKTHLPKVKIPVKALRGQSYTGSPTNDTINGSGFNDSSTKANGETDNLGDGTAVDHMNPFRIVMFIEYTGITP